jgi:HlyD family secretion protein
VAQKKSRNWIILGIAVLLAGALLYAFWPKPLGVDMGKAMRGPMHQAIQEEARTRVRDAYMVSSPIAGRLLRVAVEPGDAVVGDVSVVAQMLPSNASPLDLRDREQARSLVLVSQAALRVAEAQLSKAVADKELADLDVQRMRKLHAHNMVAQAMLDNAEGAAKAATAAWNMAKASVSVREAEVSSANARLISFEQAPLPEGADKLPSDVIGLTSPVSGSVLRVLQKSATTLNAGEAIVEVGDTSNDLEVIAELLSTDAVQVSVGDRVFIDNWGGPKPLAGVVERIEPAGFTKFSALGVEEQRVNVIIRFSEPAAQRPSLGHGYRVEVQIVVWEDDNALNVPSSALFRQDGQWAVFTVEDGRAHLQPVEAGRNNGQRAQLISDLPEGTAVVLYPGPELQDGARVEQRKAE